MSKFVYKIPAHQWETVNHKLFKTNYCCWLSKSFDYRNFPKTSTTFPPPPKKTLALCPGSCLLHHKGIENDHTIFFHVTAGNVKFSVNQWPTSHPFSFLYETRLYRSNAILEILCSRLKKIVRDSRILVDKKASDFVLSWTFVQKLLLAGLMLISSHV